MAQRGVRFLPAPCTFFLAFSRLQQVACVELDEVVGHLAHLQLFCSSRQTSLRVHPAYILEFGVHLRHACLPLFANIDYATSALAQSGAPTEKVCELYHNFSSLTTTTTTTYKHHTYATTMSRRLKGTGNPPPSASYRPLATLGPARQKRPRTERDDVY